MGAIPTQRDTWARPSAASATPEGTTPTGDGASLVGAYGSAGWRTVARTSLPGGALAPGAARRFVRETLAAWTGRAVPGAGALTERLCDDAEVVVSELVTNAVVHAGTDVGVECRLEYAEWDTGLLADAGPGAVTGTGTVSDVGPLREPDTGSLPDAGCPESSGPCIRAGADGAEGAAGYAALVVEVSDRHPSRPVRDEGAGRGFGTPEYGRGLRLVAALTQEWGVTYRRGTKCVWARLSGEEPVAYEAAVTDVTNVTNVTEATDVTNAAAAAAAAVTPEATDPHGADPRPAEIPAGTAAPSAPSAPPDSPAPPASPGPRPSRPPDGPEQDWLDRGALSFLAEASDLLAGQLDEDLLAALACQLLVPRLAEWCAV